MSVAFAAIFDNVLHLLFADNILPSFEIPLTTGQPGAETQQVREVRDLVVKEGGKCLKQWRSLDPVTGTIILTTEVDDPEVVTLVLIRLASRE